MSVFVQTRGLIALVNNNDVDNYFENILSFVYYGSVVNNLPQNAVEMQQKFYSLRTVNSND